MNAKHLPFKISIIPKAFLVNFTLISVHISVWVVICLLKLCMELNPFLQTVHLYSVLLSMADHMFTEVS